VDIRKFMRGGGWCAAAFGVAAEVPFVADEDALDVDWEKARDSLLESLQLGIMTEPELEDDRRRAIDELSRLPAGSPWETRVGPKGDEMCYWLISTAETQSGAWFLT
jgi:hypothetical protein